MAPQELQALHNGKAVPDWIALVPAALHGPDLHLATSSQADTKDLETYLTKSGDIVYMGSSASTQLLMLLSTGPDSDNVSASS